MSVLSDSSIRACLASKAENRLRIAPLTDAAVQPDSVDLTLGAILSVPRPGQTARPAQQEYPQKHDVVNLLNGPYELKSGHSVLGTVAETITMPDDLMGLLTVKSTWARLFLHQPASVVDSGYHGRLTVELTNLGPYLIVLDAGVDIAQLLIFRTTTRVDNVYGSPLLRSRYQGDQFPTPAHAPATEAVAP
jgi:dCTP deaminase